MTYSLAAPKRPKAETRGSRSSAQSGSGETLLRAVVSTIVDAAKRRENAADTLYPGDEKVKTIQKAAVSPASLTSAEWAGALASTAVGDFVAGLGPTSAASQIIGASLQIALGRSSGVRIPTVVSSAANVGFVGEGQPISVRRFTIDAPTLRPRKIASLVAFTSETARAIGFEQICRAVLGESVGLALDAALFGADAETDTAPAGLRAGAASLAPAAGGGEDALSADVVNLAGAVAGVGGANVSFVAGTDEFIKLSLRDSPFPLYVSAAMPNGTMMAIAPRALAVALDPIAEFEVSREGVLHMDDAPSQIGTEGSPDAVAAPTQSLFQTDTVALRLILGASWALRAPAASSVAMIEGVTW